MKARLAVAAAVALTALGAGCATVPACPARGGPAWRELTSTHFRVRTDLDAADAADAIRSFEEIRAAMLATVWPDAPDPPNRTEVIALRSHGELVAFTRKPGVFGVHPAYSPFAPVIVTGGDLRGSDLQVFVHELAHEISDWFLPTRPTWYAEGLATFLETLSYDRSRQRARVGEMSGLRLTELRDRGILRAEHLLSQRGPDPRLEAAAGLLVHYLIDKRPRELGELQHRLGLLESAQSAWSAALPDLPADRLDAELWRYMSTGIYLGGERPLSVPAPFVRVRAMEDAEAHAARAYLYYATNLDGDQTNEGTRTEVREATAADGTNVEALAIQFFWLAAREDSAPRFEAARLATTAHPDSWLAWVMAADVAEGDAAKRGALTKAIAIAPNVAEVLTRLALLDDRLGHWEEGVPLSLRAMRLGARTLELMSAHVRGLAHTGRCPDARLLSALMLESASAAEPRQAAAAQRAAVEKICEARGNPTPIDPGKPPAP